MNTRQMARALGRRGGQARARRLSADERRRIAALGGHARRESLQAARRIEQTLRYAAAADELRGGRPAIVRVSTCRHRLPGTSPDRK
jgi:hypothetical protein